MRLVGTTVSSCFIADEDGHLDRIAFDQAGRLVRVEMAVNVGKDSGDVTLDAHGRVNTARQLAEKFGREDLPAVAGADCYFGAYDGEDALWVSSGQLHEVDLWDVLRPWAETGLLGGMTGATGNLGRFVWTGRCWLLVHLEAEFVDRSVLFVGAWSDGRLLAGRTFDLGRVVERTEGHALNWPVVVHGSRRRIVVGSESEDVLGLADLGSGLLSVHRHNTLDSTFVELEDLVFSIDRTGLCRDLGTGEARGSLPAPGVAGVLDDELIWISSEAPRVLTIVEGRVQLS